MLCRSRDDYICTDEQLDQLNKFPRQNLKLETYVATTLATTHVHIAYMLKFSWWIHFCVFHKLVYV